MENERRQFMRYRMKESAFAALNYPVTIVGKIRDMSLGGTAFEFIASSLGGEVQESGRYSLDIFLLGSSSGLANMPCKITFRPAPARADKSPHVFFSEYISRICVAEFKDLTQSQSRALLDFLMQYSVGYAS